MSDRDLQVIVLVILAAVVVGAQSYMITLNSESGDALLDSTLTAGIAYGFYRLGKPPPD